MSARALCGGHGSTHPQLWGSQWRFPLPWYPFPTIGVSPNGDYFTLNRGFGGRRRPLRWEALDGSLHAPTPCHEAWAVGRGVASREFRMTLHAPGGLGRHYALKMEVRDSPGASTRAINQELGQRRGWIVTVAVGFALHILSVVIGVRAVGPLCGSPLLPRSREAEIVDSLQLTTGLAAECYRKIDSASLPVWMLMALGIGLVLTGVAVRIVGIYRSFARPGT